MVVLRLTEDQVELLEKALLIAEESCELVYIGDDGVDQEWEDLCDKVEKITQEISDGLWRRVMHGRL